MIKALYETQLHKWKSISFRKTSKDKKSSPTVHRIRCNTPLCVVSIFRFETKKNLLKFNIPTCKVILFLTTILFLLGEIHKHHDYGFSYIIHIFFFFCRTIVSIDLRHFKNAFYEGHLRWCETESKNCNWYRLWISIIMLHLSIRYWLIKCKPFWHCRLCFQTKKTTYSGYGIYSGSSVYYHAGTWEFTHLVHLVSVYTVHVYFL